MAPSSSTRGQVSTIDFITSVIIIITSLLITIGLIINMQEGGTFNDVKRQAFATSDYLMSSGVPEDWNQTDVIRPGLLTDDKLDTGKLTKLRNMSYQDQRTRLAGNYNYYAYLSNSTHILNITGCGMGDKAVTTDNACNPTIPADADNLIAVTRIVANDDHIITLTVLLWD